MSSLSTKFGHQMASLALVTNLVTRRRHLHEYQVGEVTHVRESIPWVRCASGNVFLLAAPDRALMKLGQF